MALNSTPRRRFGVALGVVLTGVTAALIGFAGTASAHTKDFKAYCKGDTTTFEVNLQAYATSKTKENTVKITDNGQVVVDQGFQSKFVKKIEVSATEKHTFTIAVDAWDDDKYSFTGEKVVEACKQPTSSSTTTTTTTTESQPPSSETTTTTTETTTTTVSQPPSSSQAPPVPTTTTTTEVEEEALAETGASIGLPLGIAGVLLVGGAVLLFVVRRRGKA